MTKKILLGLSTLETELVPERWPPLHQVAKCLTMKLAVYFG